MNQNKLRPHLSTNIEVIQNVMFVCHIKKILTSYKLIDKYSQP